MLPYHSYAQPARPTRPKSRFKARELKLCNPTIHTLNQPALPDQDPASKQENSNCATLPFIRTTSPPYQTKIATPKQKNSNCATLPFIRTASPHRTKIVASKQENSNCATLPIKRTANPPHRPKIAASKQENSNCATLPFKRTTSPPNRPIRRPPARDRNIRYAATACTKYRGTRPDTRQNPPRLAPTIPSGTAGSAQKRKEKTRSNTLKHAQTSSITTLSNPEPSLERDDHHD